MKSIFTVVLKYGSMLALLTSCATHQHLDDTALAYRGNDEPNLYLVLDKSQVREDIQILLYALDKAYAGKRFLDEYVFSTLKSDLSSIRGPLNTYDFCKKIESVFEKIPDHHLSAWAGEKSCSNQSSTVKRNVGKNLIANSDQQIWKVDLKRVNGKKVLVIALRSFKSASDPAWNGFIETVRKKLRKSDSIIIDLRGNGGGDDSKGLELADLLNNQKVPFIFYQKWSNPSPEAAQLQSNWIERSISSASKQQKPIPEWIKSAQAEQNKKLENARTTSFDGHVPTNPRTLLEYDKTKSLRKPTFILIDQKCASSCEDTVDYFEENPYAKRVGANTGGYRDFGNVGSLILPNSLIDTHISTAYFVYRDNRNIEKVGISPDIQVPDGDDAFLAALRLIKKQH